MNVSIPKLNKLMRIACPFKDCHVLILMREKDMSLRWEWSRDNTMFGHEYCLPYTSLAESNISEMDYLTGVIADSGIEIQKQK